MSVLTLDEAKDHLNIKDSANDTKVQTYLDAAESAIGQWVGPLEPTTVTQRVCGNQIVLNTIPAISLTSVTPTGGTAVNLSGSYVHGASGVVSWINGTSPLAWLDYDVVYVAGWADDSLPADLKLAVLEMLRHLWTSQRGGTTRPGAQQDSTTPGYLIPNMVASLIEPYTLPGIA
jgi:hypothetical protein